MSGAIRWPHDARLRAARVSVRVEDVTHADAAAAVVAEQVFHDVLVDPSAPADLDFAVEVDDVEPRARYAVRVHVDRDGSGVVAVGDLVSTRRHAVLDPAAPGRVVVPVRPVT